MKLPCPICGTATRVRDSYLDGTVTRRRRECERGHRFKTAETVVDEGVRVVRNVANDYDVKAMEEGLRAERGW